MIQSKAPKPIPHHIGGLLCVVDGTQLDATSRESKTSSAIKVD
jgi:hypothetical protein